MAKSSTRRTSSGHDTRPVPRGAGYSVFPSMRFQAASLAASSLPSSSACFGLGRCSGATEFRICFNKVMTSATASEANPAPIKPAPYIPRLKSCLDKANKTSPLPSAIAITPSALKTPFNSIPSQKHPPESNSGGSFHVPTNWSNPHVCNPSWRPARRSISGNGFV